MLALKGNLHVGCVAIQERIPDSVALEELSEAERVLFHRLTGKLHDQATELERAASDGDFNRLEADLGQITATCNACHSAFRLLPPVSERSAAG
jgi:hypothetical protein